MKIQEPDVAGSTDQGLLLHDGTVAFAWNEKSGYHLMLPVAGKPDAICPEAWLVMANLMVKASEDSAWAAEMAAEFKNRRRT